EKRPAALPEPGSTAFALHPTAITTPLLNSAAGLLSSPLPFRRWLEAASPIPICAELVIFFTLFGVTQYLICFVDLLEFLFCGLFVVGHIRMMFARQLAKGAADLLVAGRFRHTECLVIISKLHCHRLSTLCL